MGFVLGPIPSAIGALGTTGYTVSGAAYDVALAGIPFLTAISPETPFVRESSPGQKQQFDAGAEAGERSLTDWWRRSQSSFHGGAGLKYLEPDGPENPVDRTRFFASKNLDVWTPGQVTRLPDTTRVTTIGAAITGLVAGESGATTYVLSASGNTLTSWNGAANTTYTWGGTGTILSLATDGERYYIADNTGIYAGPINGGSSGTLIYNNSSSRVKLAWVKQRLMAGIGRAIYDLTPAGPALPAAVYTHPTTNWVWTDFADGPTSILASGYIGIDSAIHEITLSTTGATPTLTGGQAIPLPRGEKCLAMDAYVGSFLAIGTSRGLRIGQFDLNGTLSYGPLTVETANGVRCFRGRDRFMFAPVTAFVDGETCLVRVDLGQPTDRAGRFAYATDLLCPAAQITTGSWVALRPDGRLVFAVDNYGIVEEGVGAGSNRDGWLQTARIRMATVEPKLFRRLWVRGEFAAPGTIEATVLGSTGDTATVLPEFSSPLDIDETAVLAAAQEWVQFTFYLRDSGALEFRGYVLKALPATPPRRLYQIPLMCFDFENDRFDNKAGRVGYALERLTALEAVEDSQDEIKLELFSESGTLARQVQITQLSYRQSRQMGQTGSFGGVIIATLKTVD